MNDHNAMKDKKFQHIEKKSDGVTRRLTIRDIALKAGVSASTVSMIMNGKLGISENTRRRVQTIIDDSGYTPNQIARSLVKRRSYAVALLVRTLQHPIYSEIAAGIEAVLKPKGY